ncbi:MAG: hypothetical protein AAFQ60_09465 [Pseudomonadota bacterium]
MKVSIEHVEKTTGMLRRKTLHGVQVHVEFSEEERAVIDQRGLKWDVVLERGYSADVSNAKAEKMENRGLGRALLNAAVSGKDANTTHLTINKLMKGPDLYFLTTPLEAKGYEDALKEKLVTLKGYIVGNEGVEEKSTSFEL